MGYERLTCEVLDTNSSIAEMHERFGFQREGVFRKHRVKHGRRVDVISLGILKAEWQSFRPPHLAKLQAKGLR